MLLVPNIASAFEQLRSNRLRSLLTVLGIVIAVASTITVVSVVQGFTRYVADFLQGLGTNAMWVWPERPAGRGGQAARPDRAGRGRRRGHRPAVRWPLSRRLAADPPRRTSSSRSAATRSHGRWRASPPSTTRSATCRSRSGRPFSILDVERAHHVCVLGREVLKQAQARRRRRRPGPADQRPAVPGHRHPRGEGQLPGQQPGRPRADPLHDGPEDVPGSRRNAGR